MNNKIIEQLEVLFSAVNFGNLIYLEGCLLFKRKCLFYLAIETVDVFRIDFNFILREL